MLDCHNYTRTFHFSQFGLDPDTPDADYEIHLIQTHDPGYTPPDQELWPLYYPIIIEALKAFPGAYEAVCRDVSTFVDKIRGQRALPPRPPQSVRVPNEPNPLPRLDDLGSRT